MNEEYTSTTTLTEQTVENERDARTEKLQNTFSYDGYQVVRKELFAHLRDPAIVIRKDSITFNTACITGLEDVVYVHVMFNNDLKRIVVRGCEPEIEVMRFAGTWKDLGTWNTLTEAMDSHAVGEALFNEKCENVHVVNELDVPILCMGLKDVVVSASPEGILVSDKEQSSYIKPFVNMLDHRVMFAEKSWGSFKVIDIDKASMTIKVTLNAGHRMNYHSHQHRDEVWTVIAGEGKTVVDGMEQNVKAGDVITMSAGCRHTIIAETELKLIEVQLGEAIDVHDKQKFELEY